MILNDGKRMLSTLIWLAITMPLFSLVAMVTREEADLDGLTCYTCLETTSNFRCNEFAVDRPCPTDRNSFCQTIHVMDGGGLSYSVTKKCATRAECSVASVGCTPTDTDGGQRCVSCCDIPYCNEHAPSNDSSAVYLRTRSTNGGGVSRGSQWMTIVSLVALSAWTNVHGRHVEKNQ